MTDKEKLIDLLIEFGVEFKERIHTYTPHIINIKCFVGTNKVSGESGAYVSFDFYSNGEFIEMGVWE